MQAHLYSLRASLKMRKNLNKGDEMKGSLPGKGLGGEGGWKADGRRCPKCGVIIDNLRYWERAINSGEYRLDGFRNLSTSDVDECYFLCPECGRILFDDIEAASKSLRGQPITEDYTYPEDY
jgi:predicted RNA-binding Zn-ribbon protein involved in translation (DUF1610 family)